MLNGMLVLAMAIGTVQGQAETADNSLFAWVNARVETSICKVDVGAYLDNGSDVYFNIFDGDRDKLCCMANGGIALYSVHASFFLDLQCRKGEISFLFLAVLEKGENVNTFKYMYDSYWN